MIDHTDIGARASNSAAAAAAAEIMEIIRAETNEWNTPFTRLASSYLKATRERDELLAMLHLILPLARGYAAAHPVGSNAEYIAAAEAAVAKTDLASVSRDVHAERIADREPAP
jgi:hypothetical protein